MANTMTSQSVSSSAATSAESVVGSAEDVETSSENVKNYDDMPGPKGYPVVGTLLEYFKKENRGRMHEIQVRNVN